MKKSDLLWGLIQLIADAIAIMAGFLLAYGLRRFTWDAMPTSSIMGFWNFLWLALLALPVWLVIFGILGLYDFSKLRKGTGGFNHILIGVSTGTMLVVATIFLSKELFFSRLVVVYIWLFALILVTLERFFLKSLRRQFWKWGFGTTHIILVGAGPVALALAQKIMARKRLGYRIKGIVVENKNSQEFAKLGLPILGTTRKLNDILEIERPDEVIIAAKEFTGKKAFDLVMNCGMIGCDLKFVPETQALLTSYVSAEELAGIPVLGIKDSPLFGWGRIAKRAIDLTVSSTALLVFGLPMGIVAVLIKMTSEGPVFYKQERVGLRNKSFNLLKFRSMKVDAEKRSGPVWATADDDDRKTGIGKILRRTSLDELPQFINVFRGDMSLVGPRPERPFFVEKFAEHIPNYWYRHKVRPGLTSWAIVNGFRGNTSIEERTKYDLYYIENWSLLFDVKILLKTVGIVIRGTEAY